MLSIALNYVKTKLHQNFVKSLTASIFADFNFPLHTVFGKQNLRQKTNQINCRITLFSKLKTMLWDSLNLRSVSKSTN